MKQVIYWVFILVGIYLVATRFLGLNTILQTLGDTSLRGLATLQGRDNVKGVTQ